MDFAAFDRAIDRTTKPFTQLADSTLTGLDAIEKRAADRKAQNEKEKKGYAEKLRQSLGNG